MKEKLKKMLSAYQIDYTEEQINQLLKYYELTIEVNQNINLTTIIQPDDFIVKHFIDSLLPYKHFKENSNILDVGSGAGFPGIPLKIIRPDLKITLLDSVKKKTNFLENVVKCLNLKNIEVVNQRIEDFAKNKKESYDYVVSRAVSKLNTLAEYCLPFLKIDGEMVAYKSQNIDEEIKQAEKAIKFLGGNIKNILKLNLEENTRNILIIQKRKKSPSGYPRPNNQPRLKPL